MDALDVNQESVVRSAARDAGLDPDSLMERALLPETKTRLETPLDSFQRDRCPGVPTWVLNGERFWGKDRVELLAEALRELTKTGDPGV